MWVQEDERAKLRSHFRDILCTYVHTKAQRTQTQTNVYMCIYTRCGDLILVYVCIGKLGSVVQCWKGQTNLEARVAGDTWLSWDTGTQKEDLKTLIYTALALRLERRPQITYPCPSFRLSDFQDVSLPFSQFSFYLLSGNVPAFELPCSTSFLAYVIGRGNGVLSTKLLSNTNECWKPFEVEF